MSNTEELTTKKKVPLTIEIGNFGDSITTGRETTLALGISTGKSYVPELCAGPEIHHAGGYARSGYNSYRVYNGATRLTRPGGGDIDVAIWMTGTNDQSNSDMNERMDRYRTQKYIILGLDLVHAEHSLLSTIPPMIGWEAKVFEFNEWLASIAYNNGFEFIDPWVDMRDAATGEWLTGMAQSDGRHQTAAATTILAAKYRAKVFEIMA